MAGLMATARAKRLHRSGKLFGYKANRVSQLGRRRLTATPGRRGGIHSSRSSSAGDDLPSTQLTKPPASRRVRS
jgi:hypothetical protein